MTPSPMEESRQYQKKFWICAGLAVLTLAVYWQVTSHSFLDYDDQLYVTENPHVQAGLAKDSLNWAFTKPLAGNYHPVTALSHMLDCQLFGLESGWHHFTNLLFHTANSVLLFLLLNRMTRALWPSAFVAAMFALHPLHVESVAWVAERKDVLSTFFFILSIRAYVEYAAAKESESALPTSPPAQARRFHLSPKQMYLLSLFLFALGLLSKPMLVTLPCVLLLLDIWPLGRLSLGRPSAPVARTFFSVLLEKIPFFALTIAFSIATWLIQRHEGAMGMVKSLTLSLRLENVVVSYLRYFLKTFWPAKLAGFYPFPKAWPGWFVTLGVLLIIFMTAAAVWQWKKRPYFAVGWFWFFGTLVPVIGLVQVGRQSLADRYTYIPLIGLFIIVAWGAVELAQRYRKMRLFLVLAGGLSVAVCAALTAVETSYWRDTTSLFARALAVTTHNDVAEYTYGRALMVNGDNVGALPHFQEAIRINPDYGEALSNLGLIFVMRGQTDEGIALYRRGIKVLPKNFIIHYNLAHALATQDKLEEAIPEFKAALEMNPSYADGRHELAVCLQKSGKNADALEQYTILLQQDPDNATFQTEMQELQGEMAKQTIPTNSSKSPPP